MSSGLYTHTTRGTGTVLTAAIYNADHVNHITNQNPTMTGAFADSVGQFQSNVDPGGIGSEALSPNLAGELERLRFCIKRITGGAQWYEAPPSNLAQALGGAVPGTIATGGAIPLTLRRTENNSTSDFEVLRFAVGSGVGDVVQLAVKGNGANGVTDFSIFTAGVERARFSASLSNRYQAQGYLTPVAGTPIITADASAVGTITYEPFVGNLIPILHNGVIAMRIFTPLTLTLNNPNHAAATLYDVFAWSQAGVITIGTGPAWSVSTPGTSGRGVGGVNTELVRTNGLLVNANAITMRNGAATFAVTAGLATYLGTILIAAVGTVTCHRSYGQNRQWGVWNMYNRQPLHLKGGDPNATWAYSLTPIRASRADSTNKLTVLAGLAETPFDFRFSQSVELAVAAAPGAIRALNGIGLNSTTVVSGKSGSVGLINQSASGMVPLGDMVAEFLQVPMLGVNNIQALERVSGLGGVATATWQGTEPAMLLSAQWMG